MRVSSMVKLAIVAALLAAIRGLGLLETPPAAALNAGCAGYPNFSPNLEDANEAPTCDGTGPGCYECMYPNSKGPGYFLCAEYSSTLMYPDCSDRIFSLEEIPPSFLEGPPVAPEDPLPPDVGTPAGAVDCTIHVAVVKKDLRVTWVEDTLGVGDPAEDGGQLSVAIDAPATRVAAEPTPAPPARSSSSQPVDSHPARPRGSRAFQRRGSA